MSLRASGFSARHCSGLMKCGVPIAVPTAVNVVAMQVRKPELELKLDASSEVIYGQQSMQKVVITNTGDGVATNINVHQVMRIHTPNLSKENTPRPKPKF